jgi:hypothetical protein
MDGKKSLGESLQVVALTPALFAVFIPGFFDALKNPPTADNVKGVRTGLYTACGLTVTLGAAISLADDDPVPFTASVLLSGIMAGAYEYAIRRDGTSANAGVEPSLIATQGKATASGVGVPTIG